LTIGIQNLPIIDKLSVVTHMPTLEIWH